MIAHGTEPDRKELRGRWDDTSNGEPISACTGSCYEFIHIEGPTDDGEDDLQYLAWLDLCAFVEAIAKRVRKHLARLPGGKSAQVTKLGATGIAPRNRGPPRVGLPRRSKMPKRRGPFLGGRISIGVRHANQMARRQGESGTA